MILLALGARPEIIKFFPIVKKLEENGREFKVLFTGQHYDYELSESFFEFFGYKPDFNLNLKTSLKEDIKAKTKEVLEEIRPNVVVVLGDTNTTLAVGEATKEVGIKLAHVEAGLRSFDSRMPEEKNRIAVDKISDYLFAPTKISATNLREERVGGKIYETGNVIVDVLDFVSKKIKEEVKEDYILFTAHREENVVPYERLSNIMRILNLAGREMRVIFPIHPRTKSKIEEYGFEIGENIEVIDPQPYGKTISLIKNAKLVVTDSGGLQEEARYFKKPVITLRETTERVETLLEGTNVVVGNHPFMFRYFFELFRRGLWPINGFKEKNPFGDGKAGERISRVLEEI